jgi:hypothetical protein
MDQPREQEQPEDLEPSAEEREGVKGGAGATWYLRNENSPGATVEGAQPHLRSDITGG